MNDYLLGPDGLLVCHESEGLKLEAYPDPASPLGRAIRSGKAGPAVADLSGAPWTIGRGDTGPDVVPGLTITKAEADERFARRMNSEFVPGVRSRLQRHVTQKQFDAMVSLAYNIGLGNFASSTLLRMVNNGDMSGAAQQFKRWDKAQGQTLKGLQRRRYAEAFIFSGGEAATGIRKAAEVFP